MRIPCELGTWVGIPMVILIYSKGVFEDRVIFVKGSFNVESSQIYSYNFEKNYIEVSQRYIIFPVNDPRFKLKRLPIPSDTSV